MKKTFISNCFVQKGDTQSGHDLIYMKKLPDSFKKTLMWFFNEGSKILDVTAGRRKIWDKTLLYNSTFDGGTYFDVTFVDGSHDSEADVVSDFRKLPFPDNSFDLIVFDPPFTELKNSQEQFGVKKSRKADREFYFRGLEEKWIPPEAYFFQTWKEFNRVSRNGLIVKISERFKDLEEIPVITYMDLAYNKRFNHKSEFQRCVNIGYRGMRAGTGAFTSNPQRVLSYYAVYKKDRRKR